MGNCICCGVTFEGQYHRLMVGNQKEYYNFKWDDDSFEICVWCANLIPARFVDFAQGFDAPEFIHYHVMYNINNFRTYPPLQERINSFSKSQPTLCCPRCNGELKDHMSYALGEMIKKCPSCGWC